MSKLTLVMFVYLSVMATSPASQYKTYKEWKVGQDAYYTAHGKPDVAQEMTIADYFGGYLIKQSNLKEAINQVSSRLSPQEVAELMTIYVNSVFGTHAPQLPTQADNSPKTQAK